MAISDVQALFEQGIRLVAAGDRSSAEQAFREAIDTDDEVAALHSNLAMLLQDRGAMDEAEVAFLRAVSLQPSRADHYVNLGSLLIAMCRTQDAETCLRAAIDLDPRERAAWTNLGVLLASVKRDVEAERCFETALAIEPGHRLTRFNSSYLLLRQQRFEAGWQALESRVWYAGLEARLSMPRWNGETLQGRSILIGFEAGHGDMIQFVRYAAVLKRRGATRVGLICHPALARLFESLDDVDELFPFDQDLPARDWNFWTPPLSVPFHVGTRADSIPAEIPYLKASAADLDRHERLLPPRRPGRRRIGLVWQGSPSFENDAARSLPSLDVLAPLAGVPDVDWVSLQKGPGQAQAHEPPAGMTITPLGEQLSDFADTAAAIQHLDLVISVDTAVAHLAGALGRPCWLLLPFHRTDWRWFDDRDDSPWYPVGMRLFRQSSDGRWSDVIEAVVSALRSTTPDGAGLP